MAILTPARLAQLAATPLLENSWYYVAAATFSVCNEPEEVPRIFEYMMSRTNPSDQMAMSRNMREALLKGAALGGLPKSINSLTQLKHVTPNHLREISMQRDRTWLADGPTRGKLLFDHVYGKVSKRVSGQMNSAYPDLEYYAINHVYGPLLSYSGVLPLKETSFVIVACLIPQDVNPQLKGHLKGALNNGATKEEVMSLRDMSMLICKWCGIQWKSEVAKL
jgi:alkylhydroperoxidase/carboxymuconolactone decarboxylase family protein YurZ